MDALEMLDMSKNSIQGKIPSEWGLLVNLMTVNLDQNEITGRLPKSWRGMNIHNMDALDLGKNI